MSSLSATLFKRVLNVLLVHQKDADVQRVIQWWSNICPPDDLWLAYGGTPENFERLKYPNKRFISDPKLRTRDHQREKQSYNGIFDCMAPVLRESPHDYVYLSEFDHLPLIKDLNQRQVTFACQDDADVMGHCLQRIDHTAHPHYVYHAADPAFLDYWKRITVRPDPTVAFSVFGTGMLWKREAFLAVADRVNTIDCYLELFLPTFAHHTGYRIRRWPDDQHLISALPKPEISLQNTHGSKYWTIHPIKEIPSDFEKYRP
jgi:hypothetical protein